MSADNRAVPVGHVTAGLDILASGMEFPDLLRCVLELVVGACACEGGRIEIRGYGEVSAGSLPSSSPPDGQHVVGHEIVSAGEPLGSVSLKLSDESASGAGSEAAILELAAGLVAAAWAQERALQAEREGREEEKGLARAGEALARTIRLGDVLPLILEELRAVVPYDTASVQELRGDQVVIVGGSGINLAVFFGFSFDVTSPGTPNADVIRNSAPVIVRDILGDHPYRNFPHPEHEMSGVRCWMGVPLFFGDECVGMLTLDKYEPDFYTERHAQLAQAFANQAAIALENARAFELAQHEVEVRREAEERLREANEALHERMAEIEALQEHLREQSVRDPLTGVFNRRYLMETLERELHRAQRADAPLVVAVVDVDHFKSINDILGHEAGDQVLSQVAAVLDTHVRDEDVVCRYGGEEFVVVLPGTSIDVARERAEQWQDDLRSMALPAGLADQSITISVGLALASHDAAKGELVVRAADEAMYVAKRLGRDRIEVARD